MLQLLLRMSLLKKRPCMKCFTLSERPIYTPGGYMCPNCKLRKARFAPRLHECQTTFKQSFPRRKKSEMKIVLEIPF